MASSNLFSGVLLQEIDGAVFDGLDSCRNVDATADEHNRHEDAQLEQALLQCAPIHAGHPQVEDQAAVPSGVEGSQELDRRTEDRSRESGCADEFANGV